MTALQIRQVDLQQACKAGLMTTEQADQLWRFWAEQRAEHVASDAEVPRFKMSHLLFYFGGLLAISAVSIFVTIAWDAFGAWPLLGFGLAVALLAYALTRRFIEVERQPIAAGTTAALLIAAVPLVLFALQHVSGFWDSEMSYRDYHRWIDWRWLMMEFGTLIAGAVVMWRFRLPFAMLPIAITLWYMSMDVAAFLAQDSDGWWSDSGWKLRSTVSMVFGLLMLAGALYVEIRQHAASNRIDRRDFAFWLYTMGLLTFWGGLSSQSSGSELGKLIYCLINVGLIVLGTALVRRVFVVFGALGVMGYLGYLSYSVFQDSLLFTAALGALGIGIVFAGVAWNRREAALQRQFSEWLPLPLRRAIASRTS